MKNWIANHGFIFILLAIVACMLASLVYTGWINSQSLRIIEIQQTTIDNQQRVIEDITGVEIPEGYEAVPGKPTKAY